MMRATERRWIHPFFTTALVLVGAWASFAPATLEAQEAGNAAATVEARERAFAQTMADRDFEAFLTFLSEEAVFFAGERPLRGKDAVADAWAPFFEAAEPPFSWAPDLVEALPSGALALSTGPVLDPAGQQVGRFNTIWRLDPDGVWRVVFDKGS